MTQNKSKRDELKMMQSYPLDLKVAKAKTRIREFVDYVGLDNCYISFSGGKDSTVLLNIVREEYPDIPAVFCDTGLEYPEIREFVNEFENVEIVKPKKTFREVLLKYGYPIVSKEQSQCIYEIRHGSEKTREIRLHGGRKKGLFKIAEKWKFLIDAPFEISEKCCYHLKKSPLMRYERRTGRHPIMGTLVEESRLRLKEYYRNGCNVLDENKAKSRPLSIWTNNDILEYIDTKGLEITPVYGEVKKNESNEYYTTGVRRTGCIFCAFGAHMEDCPNRYQQLRETHPKLWDYCINGGEYNEDGNWVPSREGLGFGEVLDYLGVEYE